MLSHFKSFRNGKRRKRGFVFVSISIVIILTWFGISDFKDFPRFGANVDNIKKSSYTDEKRYQIAAFVAYVNGDTVYSDRSSSWFGRCLRDTYKISKHSIDAIVRDVKRKNFWAAASKLFLAIKVGSPAASHPRISIATAAGYLAFCEANKVS